MVKNNMMKEAAKRVPDLLSKKFRFPVEIKRIDSFLSKLLPKKKLTPDYGKGISKVNETVQKYVNQFGK